MKQLLPLFLFLLPCLALAQYPSNGNQKITLGEQTTADGLIFRGVASTDTVRKPSIDTMAYMVLDTTTNIMWHYKKATSNAWLRVGGSITSGLTGTLPVANGGTGLTTFTAANRIPYSTSATALTTNSNFTYDGNRLTIPEAIFNGTTNYGYIFSAKASTSSSGAGIFIRGTQGGDTTLPTTFGSPYINIGGVENRLNAIQTIGFGFTNGTGGFLSPAEIGYITNSLSGFTNGHLVFATRQSTSNVAPVEKMRITNAGNVGIGQTTPTAVLHLKAGTATASTAPLKFTSGTNLTTAEAGAMEFNGTNLFFSPSTTRHTVNHGLTGSATLNFPSTTTLLSADLTITVTGAADGDVVSLGVPNAAVNANTSYSAWVSSANTVTVRFNNYSSGTVDPASGLFKVFVTK
jgi:hypothetical protein